VKTAIVGAGQGCYAVLDLLEQGQLQFLHLEILAVVDINPSAPAMEFAKQKGWSTPTRIDEALALPDLELVIELTGLDSVLDQIHRLVPPGVRVMDHVAARVFWDLEEVAGSLRRELKEKTELQARLARDRKRLQHILDAIPDIVVVIDANRNITHSNQRFELLTAKSQDMVHGKPIREAFSGAHGEDWSEEFAGTFEEVMRTGRPVIVTRARRTRAGAEGHFQFSADPIFDEDLEVMRVVVTSREITEQVMLKRETEESARRFQQIVDTVHGVITIKDVQGRYQLVNPRAERIAGIPREQMIGKTATELFPEAVAAVIDKNDQATLAKGAHHAVEESMTIGGKERRLYSERFPLTDYKGEVIGICCITRDMTRRRQLQRQLVSSERLAAVGQLSAGVAHELNNPLSGILAFGEDLLLEAGDDDPRRKDYEIIVNETMRCRRIVRDLLEFSRQKPPERHRVQLNDVVSRVLVMVERQVSFHNIKFHRDDRERLPDVQGDPLRIQQAILNLVINARDSMDGHGEIHIRTRALNADRTVEVSVTDRGCGIPDERLAEIFEPFVSSKGDQGYGLGLPSVRAIVEQHDGRVEVESEVGIGSTFRILLPVMID
jgi:PAS domain S-box-containing protein